MRFRLLIMLCTVLSVGCATSQSRSPFEALGDGVKFTSFSKFRLAAASDDFRPVDPDKPYVKPEEVEHREPKTVGHKLLLYIPNRIFDMFDVVRLRARLGPGFGLGLRVTRPVTLFAGAYTTIWVGIPGPRNRKKLNLPLGYEVRAAFQASVADFGPALGVEYGPMEIGLDTQLAMVGIAAGVEPWDAIDFIAGIFLFDPRGDDY